MLRQSPHARDDDSILYSCVKRICGRFGDGLTFLMRTGIGLESAHRHRWRKLSVSGFSLSVDEDNTSSACVYLACILTRRMRRSPRLDVISFAFLSLAGGIQRRHALVRFYLAKYYISDGSTSEGVPTRERERSIACAAARDSRDFYLHIFCSFAILRCIYKMIPETL